VVKWLKVVVIGAKVAFTAEPLRQNSPEFLFFPEVSQARLRRASLVTAMVYAGRSVSLSWKILRLMCPALAMLAVLDSTLTGVTGSSMQLLLSDSADCAALSAEDALGLLRLVFITRLRTGSLSEDLARLRANFNIFLTHSSLILSSHQVNF
jgi:hypothetical protein